MGEGGGRVRGGGGYASHISKSLLSPALSPVATPICSIVNLVFVRSVLFFNGLVLIWVYIGVS